MTGSGEKLCWLLEAHDWSALVLSRLFGTGPAEDALEGQIATNAASEQLQPPAVLCEEREGQGNDCHQRQTAEVFARSGHEKFNVFSKSLVILHLCSLLILIAPERRTSSVGTKPLSGGPDSWRINSPIENKQKKTTDLTQETLGSAKNVGVDRPIGAGDLTTRPP
jgi:hypothetical protein